MRSADYLRVAGVVALLLLALALMMLARELAAWRVLAPDLLLASARWEQAAADWHATAEQLAPVAVRAVDVGDRAVVEAGAVRGWLPDVIATTEKARVTAEAALRRVDTVQQDLPTVLAATDGVVREAARFNDQLPAILAEVERANDAVPQVLAQAEALRQEAPQLLGDAGALIDKAATVPRQAAQGAVSGTVKGVLDLPFAVLRSTTRATTELVGIEARLSSGDHRKLQDGTIALLDSGATVGERRWRGFWSGNRGRIEVVRAYVSDGLTCRDVKYAFSLRDGYRPEVLAVVCRSEGGEWQQKELRALKR